MENQQSNGSVKLLHQQHASNISNVNFIKGWMQSALCTEAQHESKPSVKFVIAA